jgi:hypothetical protein
MEFVYNLRGVEKQLSDWSMLSRETKPSKYMTNSYMWHDLPLSCYDVRLLKQSDQRVSFPITNVL